VAGEPGRLQSGEEGPGDGFVDLDAADIEAIDAAALDQDFARAVIAGRGVAAAIVGMQAATANARSGRALATRALPSLTAPRALRGSGRVFFGRYVPGWLRISASR